MMHNTIIGFGSIFHKQAIDGIENTSNAHFLGAHELFYAGRYAIKYVIHGILEHQHINAIWIPNYYCPFVKNWLEQEFESITYYDIDPFDATSKIDWSLFTANDIVIANNYWGLKEHQIPNGERPIVIEDHSHGWLSKGCMDSQADFCIASLRKTLPIPLGGIAWKPVKSKCSIPLKPLEKNNIAIETNPMLQSWALIDSAMETKATCNKEEEKSVFLQQYSQGEVLLRNTQEIVPLLAEHETVIRNALFKDFNAYKKTHLAYILQAIHPSQAFKIINEESKTPFGLLLAFKERELFKDFKQFLITHMIYPAELWPQNNIAQDYKFLVNIHIDFRYNTKDLEFMADTINRWTLQRSSLQIE